VLYHWPTTEEENMDSRFDVIPWINNVDQIKAWQKGLTGIPMVDAGMRELWQTGYMHNRVRMIVASLLTKHMMVDWREGAKWFMDTLVDADVAQNSLSWQWTAGSGVDAAPYFRIFNPVTQGEKFDPKGDYVRRWVPELAELPDKWIHQPWAAPEEICRLVKFVTGKDYPLPIVDLKSGRERALSVWEAIKGAAA
jgi:deoxyribodipyrimidine photo-lyase